mmetsp:Transcript_16509/g.26818  ORF Transcript_16509/g.26818 Transcript_16509/m.26818 type:complete len:293 (+) Transcript_16509:860-1738(+)
MTLGRDTTIALYEVDNQHEEGLLTPVDPAPEKYTRTKWYVCLCLVSSSLGLNVVLASALVWWVSSNQAYSPIPERIPNATQHRCPFKDGDRSIDSPGGVLAATQLGYSFLNICWKDFAGDERGLDKSPYQVYMSEPWGGPPRVLLPDPIYSGRALHLNITDLLPASEYLVQVKSLNVSSQLVSLRTKNAGYCGNPSDVNAYRSTKKTMKTDIQSCMIKNFLSDKKIASCISKHVGLSTPCAECWVAEAHCTINYCFVPCHKPSSKECKDCSEQKCFPACVRCSGMPRWSFPP